MVLSALDSSGLISVTPAVLFGSASIFSCNLLIDFPFSTRGVLTSPVGTSSAAELGRPFPKTLLVDQDPHSVQYNGIEN
jgi:hypothetical protein